MKSNRRDFVKLSLGGISEGVLSSALAGLAAGPLKVLAKA
jgi:hypothetical protein